MPAWNWPYVEIWIEIEYEVNVPQKSKGVKGSVIENPYYCRTRLEFGDFKYGSAGIMLPSIL